MTNATIVNPELAERPAGGSFWDEQPLRAWWSWWHVPELAAVFVTGTVVMKFLYGTGDGVPGHDSFYHVKMAVLMPEIGLIDKFKWLTTTIFADRFVSHHWGFHALMTPFVHAGKWLVGDYLAGAKWGITFFFSVSMVLFQLLLMTQRVRMRWLWLGLYLVMPAQFFSRHMFIRAIAPSLACMLLVLVLMFRRRYVWCALAIACYVHVYLGAVFYVPLLVGAYFVVGLLGEEGDRVSWKLPAWAIVGTLVGLLTHPYGADVLGFLEVQVLGSGLTPDIPVGREWKSYEGKLWEVVFIYFGFTLSMLVVCVAARLRMGGRLNAREAAVLVINLVFLTMAFRQRRFIEYWPPFGLLASALLLAPLLDRMTDNARQTARRIGPARLWLMALIPIGVTLVTALYLLFARGRRLDIGPFVAEWRIWAFVAGLVFWVPMSRVWQHGVRSGLRLAGRSAGGDAGCYTEVSTRATPLWLAGGVNVLCGGLMILLAFGPILVVWGTGKLSAARSHVSLGAWVVLGIAYAAAPWIGGSRGRETDGGETVGGAARTEVRGSLSVMMLALLTTVLTGGTFVLLLILGGAGQFVSVQRSARCNFDLPAVRGAMDYLRANSPTDAIVFTDDWDIFPLYFYHNHHNRYIVGLDPEFSHAHDPVLWERYVKITQSKRFPVVATVDVLGDDTRTHRKTVEVRLEDIRDHFGASFVITDPDHGRLARNLESTPGLAERVYPSGELTGKPRPPFTIYRIKPAARSGDPTRGDSG